VEAVGRGFEEVCPANALPHMPDERLRAMQALCQLCADSPSACVRAHHNQAAVRAAGAALASADAAALPPEEVACFSSFIAAGLGSRAIREYAAPRATATAAEASERETGHAAEPPLRELADALPSLIRVAVRLAAAPSTQVVVHALSTLAIVLGSPEITERAAGGCDAAASAAASTGFAKRPIRNP
jgi:hypothetical protein